MRFNGEHEHILIHTLKWYTIKTTMSLFFSKKEGIIWNTLHNIIIFGITATRKALLINT